MDPPTGADIRDWSPPDFPWAKLGWLAPTDPMAIDPLDKRVEWAVGYVEGTTWRPLDTVVSPDEPGNLPTVETGHVSLVPIAEQAVLLATLQMLAEQSRGYITATMLQDYLQSFTAGSYSETRATAETVLRSRGSVENPLVNKWRPLSDLLYLLMTPDAYDYWRFRLTGVNPPAGGYVGQDFGMGRSARPAAWGPGIESWPVGNWP